MLLPSPEGSRSLLTPIKPTSVGVGIKTYIDYYKHDPNDLDPSLSQWQSPVLITDDITTLPEDGLKNWPKIVFLQLATFLRPSNSQTLSRPMQRKLVALINCQLLEEEGRARAIRSARSLGERSVTELILQVGRRLHRDLADGICNSCSDSLKCLRKLIHIFCKHPTACS